MERDIQNHPGAAEELRALGFRSVPVTAVGDRTVAGFHANRISELLNLGVEQDARNPAETIPLLGQVVRAVERAVRQMPDDKLDWNAPDRDRPMREFTYHILMFVRLTIQGLESGVYPERSDAHGRSYTSFQDVADYGLEVIREYDAWAARQDPAHLAALGPRGDDDRSAAERLDLIAGHAVQHLRQLYVVLRQFGIEPKDSMPDSAFPQEYVLTIVW